MDTQKVHVKSAVGQNGAKANVNLSAPTLLTAKIAQILPIFHRECVPGDHFNVTSHMFSRFLPLSVPSYVNLTYRTMSVFVPYHQVFDGCESFMSNQPYFKGKSNTLPRVQVSQIYKMFTDTNFGLSTQYEVATAPSHTDLQNLADDELYVFTAKGFYFWKVLNLLGYRLPHNFADENYPQYFNALPLLAFAHAYNSYLSYSPDYNTSLLSETLENIKRSPGTTIDAQVIYTLLNSILLTYEENFFTTAWMSPNSIYEHYENEFKTRSIGVPGVDGTATEYDGFGGSVVDLENRRELTAQQIRLVMKFDDYFRRSNYSGSKDIQQIYSRFGVQIDDYKCRYPYFLNESSKEVQIGDVTSTADTDGAPIGAYAGKAIGSDDAHFEFDSKDYGMLFTFAWLAPRPIYFQGVDKELLRFSPFDFYTPELDQGFASAINCEQVSAETTHPGTTWGFCPLYSEYLYPQAAIVGDFTRFIEMKAWHFGRIFDGDVPGAQSDAFIYLPSTGTEYERIFNIDDTQQLDVDSCYMTIQNEVHAVRPMKDFTGKLNLGEGDLGVQVNGSQIN